MAKIPLAILGTARMAYLRSVPLDGRENKKSESDNWGILFPPFFEKEEEKGKTYLSGTNMSHKLIPRHCSPTDPFTTLEVRKPSHDVPELRT